jgi:hypothetical protein
LERMFERDEGSFGLRENVSGQAVSAVTEGNPSGRLFQETT